jgi:hypothetical protein
MVGATHVSATCIVLAVQHMPECGSHDSLAKDEDGHSESLTMERQPELDRFPRGEHSDRQAVIILIVQQG